MNTRKILRTRGRGAGWVSGLTESASPDQRRFLASYGPLVEAVEAFEEKASGLTDEKRFALIEWKPLRMECVRVGGGEPPLFVAKARPPEGQTVRQTPYAVEARPGSLASDGRPLVWTFQAQVPAHLPVEQFLTEWVVRFGSLTPPYLGSIFDLVVEEIPAGALVRVRDVKDGMEEVVEVFPERDLF